MGPGRNASDKMLAVLDMQIAGRIFWVRDQLPSEKAGVKVGGTFWVGRAQIGPAERAGDLGDSDSGALVGLPDAENRAGGILDDRHAASVHDVKSWGKNLAAELLRLGDGCVNVFHCDVDHPVRRNAHRTLVGTQGASGGSIAALKFEYSVNTVRTHRHVLGNPAEERVVEVLGGVLVGGVEFNPAEGAGRMLVDVCHSGRKVHQA